MNAKLVTPDLGSLDDEPRNAGTHATAHAQNCGFRRGDRSRGWIP